MTDFVDKTGTPRTDDDIRDALECITEIMIKSPLVLPKLTVHSGIIRDALRELLERREFETWLKRMHREAK